MSKVKVQCKGSGQSASAGINAKRALCSYCRRMQDVASNGNIKRHDRITSKSKLKRTGR